LNGTNNGNWTTRQQSNSPTVHLADNQLADTPTLRQTNSPKLIYGRFDSWTLQPRAGRFGQSLKPRSDWQVSGTRKKRYTVDPF